MKTRLLIPIILITVLLAACGGAQMSEAPAAEPSFSGDYGGGLDVMEEAEGEFARSQSVSSNAYKGSAVDTSPDEIIERMVIKNADVAIVVESPADAMGNIMTMAEEMGGYVVHSNMYQTTLQSGAKVDHANITIRVPSGMLDAALEQIKAGAGEVLRENVSGDDVTQEYTDLGSRLKNLEAAEAQLTEIMDDAYKTEEVLQVYNELVRVREEIEVIKGRMKYFEQAAALSSITVDLTADEAVQPLSIGGWKPVGTAKDAIQALINALQWLAEVAIWAALCVLPIGLLLGIPGYFIGRKVWKIRKERKAEKAVESPEEA